MVASFYPTASSGEVSIEPGHNVTCNTADNLDQLVIKAGGTLTVASTYFNVTTGPDAGADLKIYGTLQWNSGWAGYCGLWEVYSGGVFNMNCGNYGTACNTWNIKPGGVMNFQQVFAYINGCTINNEGAINFTPDFGGRYLRSNTPSGPGRINNLATGVINNNTTYDFGLGDSGNGNGETNIEVNNNGTINLTAGSSLSYYGLQGFNQNGTINFASNAVLTNHGILNLNGGQITGTGKIVNNEGWRTNVPYSLPAGITLELKSGYSNYFGGPKELTVNGTVNIDGRLSNDGFSSDVAKLKISSTGTANLASNGTFYVGNATVTNNGTFNFLSTVANNAMHLSSASQLINNGTVKVYGTGHSYVYGDAANTVTNNGTVEMLANGNFNFTNFGASVTFNNMATGIIKGKGTLTFPANFTNAGSIEPGSSPGQLIFNGAAQPLQLGSHLKIEIAGSGAGTGYDNLLNGSSLTLNGKLTVTETSAGVPLGGYDIITLTSGTITGSFSQIQLPSNYSLSVNANKVTVIKNVFLPLRFLSFTGRTNNGQAFLQWTTENEANTSRFIVERSNDAMNYSEIGNVAAANTAGLHAYSFTDAQPFDGTNHYRLKQVDRNGRFTYSEVLRLFKGAKNQDLLTYPNPVLQTLFVDGAIEGSITYRMYSATGMLLKSGTKPFVQPLAIDLRDLPQGTYLLRLDNGGKAQSSFFFKQ